MKEKKSIDWLRAWCAICKKVVQRRDPDRVKATWIKCPVCWTNLEVMSTGGHPLKGSLNAEVFGYGRCGDAVNHN